jgi:DNA-binding MarR family transcriptional regulator
MLTTTNIITNGTGGVSYIDALGAARTFVRLVRALEHQVRRAHEGGDLSLSELSVLGQIDRGNTLPSTLARTLDLDPARVTRITDRLFDLGYIGRAADPEDRRRCRLRLTEAGALRLEEGRVAFGQAMSRLMSGLTAEEESALQIGTEGLRRVLDEHGNR